MTLHLKNLKKALETEPFVFIRVVFDLTHC
jgi:hypothetical protein